MIEQTLSQTNDEKIKAFLETLSEEFVALKNRDLDNITRLSESKAQLLAQLSDIDSLAQTQAETETEYKNWRQEFATQLKRCRMQNEINGKLIELSLVSNRKLAAVLAKARDKDSLTYNGHGLTQPSSSLPLGIKA